MESQKEEAHSREDKFLYIDYAIHIGWYNQYIWKKWRILMNRVLENNNLKVTISDSGAELISVWDKSRNAERIWRGDSAVWGRHAPILFPFVGKVAGGKYSYRGREYKMTSHGFARQAV